MKIKNSKLKILFVTRPIAPPWDEASKNFAYNLAQEVSMQNSDLEIHLLTKGVLADLPSNIVQHPIYTSSEKDFRFSQKLRSLFFQIKTRNNFNLAHYFFTPAKLNSFFIKHLIKNKKTKTIQTVATLREDIFSDKEIKKIMFGDIIITYSDCAKNKLNTLGFKSVKRIYPGIDLDYYSPACKNFRFLMNNDLLSEDFIITYPGEYSRLGAIDDIIKTIRFIFSLPLLQRGIKGNFKFILACRVKNKKDARKKEKIIKQLKKIDSLNKVVFIDIVPDMAKLYNSSDIIIFPVRDMRGKFDVPLAVIEAMACEKPVIISDIPILREFANGKNSVIIKSGDPEKLSSAILALYQNKNEREIIGKAARQFTEENFDIKKIAGEYRKVYESF